MNLFQRCSEIALDIRKKKQERKKKTKVNYQAKPVLVSAESSIRFNSSRACTSASLLQKQARARFPPFTIKKERVFSFLRTL